MFGEQSEMTTPKRVTGLKVTEKLNLLEFSWQLLLFYTSAKTQQAEMLINS